MAVFDDFIKKEQIHAKRDLDSLKHEGVNPPKAAEFKALKSAARKRGHCTTPHRLFLLLRSVPPTHLRRSHRTTPAYRETSPVTLAAAPPAPPTGPVPRQPPNPAAVAAAGNKAPAARNPHDCLLIRACFNCKEASFMCSGGRNPCQRPLVGLAPTDPNF